MARECQITGRSGRMGYNVSHAHNRTKRRFDINLQNSTFFSDLGVRVRLKVTPRAVRLVEKKGGIDQFVLQTKERDLPAALKVLRRMLLKQQTKQS